MGCQRRWSSQPSTRDASHSRGKDHGEPQGPIQDDKQGFFC